MAGKGIIVNDHDLLIQLDTKMNHLIETLKDLPALESRLRDAENKTVQNSTEIANVKKDLDIVQKKSNQWDLILAVITLLSGIITLVFGGS